VDVNVPQLREQWSAGGTVPVYVAVVTFSYSGQPMDDLFDASVFAANPSRPGNGPGGMDVLSAAR
jgi:hypothetical protein